MKNLITVVFCISVCAACKEFNIDIDTEENLYRIKMIIEFDEFGDELNRNVFNYENEKLVLWQYCNKNSNYEMEEEQEITISYNGDIVTATMFRENGDTWNIYQKCTYTVYNNHFQKKIVSRYAFPQCIDCWKYVYSYSDSKLIEWNKFIKNEKDDWEICRKVEYNYDKEKLANYNDFVICDNSQLKLDYIKKYFHENEKVTGWEGGIYIENADWQPTQKVEYKYEFNNVSVVSYSVWDTSEGAWKFFGSINYSYDENNFLIEKYTSNGNKTVYVYEKGQGNASLFYHLPEENNEVEPRLKSSLK